MELSSDAKNLLGILNHLEQKNVLTTLDAIRTNNEWAQQGKDDQSLTMALDQLIGHKLISQTGITYSLTIQGFAQAKQFLSEGFTTMMLAAEQSVTSRKFCKQVYGRNLCQFNMMDQSQLDKLLEVMNLSKGDHILDLGCGVGLISEYISDVTGANVLGIDFASGVIKRAQERTHKKRERLSYQVMDMDELNLPEKSFSGVISIDTLYFVNDLGKTIQSVKSCLQDNGQMGIFFSTSISAGETIESLEPDRTPLGKVLQECGLSFRTWIFTQDEKNIWEKIIQVAEELRDEYDAEGNLDICESSISEARSVLDFARTGRLSRYFYHVQ